MIKIFTKIIQSEILSVSLYYWDLTSYPEYSEQPFLMGQLTAVMVWAGTSISLIIAFHQQFHIFLEISVIAICNQFLRTLQLSWKGHSFLYLKVTYLCIKFFKEIGALCALLNIFLTKQQEKKVLLMHKTERNVKYARLLVLILDFRES